MTIREVHVTVSINQLKFINVTKIATAITKSTVT